MKFINEKEIKKCIAMIEIGEVLKVDPTAYIAEAVKALNNKKVPTKDRIKYDHTWVGEYSGD